jgi:hypothetical protein
LPDPKNFAELLVIEPTRATACLPGLDIEIIHSRSPAGDAEQISINLQAVSSLEAFSRYVESTNPSRFGPGPPWIAAAQAMLPPGMTWPQVGHEPTTQSADGRAAAPDAARAT